MMIDYDIENELSPALVAGEKLVWTGRPKKGIVFRGVDLFMIPFSLLWGGFALFWEFTVIAMGAPFFFMLFGIPFVVIGLYMIIGRFFVDARRRANTVYGISKDRVIIKSGVFKQEIQSVSIQRDSTFIMNEKKDLSGSILIGPSDSRNAILQGVSWPGVRSFTQLDMIEDVKSVYDILLNIQKK